MRNFAALALLALVASTQARTLRSQASKEADTASEVPIDAEAAAFEAAIPKDADPKVVKGIKAMITKFGTDQDTVRVYHEIDPNGLNYIARSAGYTPTEMCEKMPAAERKNKHHAICDGCFNAPPCAAESLSHLERVISGEVDDPTLARECPALIATGEKAATCRKYAKGGERDLGINLQVGITGHEQDFNAMSWGQLNAKRIEGLQASLDGGKKEFEAHAAGILKESEGESEKVQADMKGFVQDLRDIWENVVVGVERTIAGTRGYHENRCDFRTVCHGDPHRGTVSGKSKDKNCKCKCNSNYGGERCEFFKCSEEHCSFSGTPVTELVESVDKCTCKCKAGRRGAKCEERASTCTRFGSCSGKGHPEKTTVYPGESCGCKCDKGYSGDQCETMSGTPTEPSFCGPFMCQFVASMCPVTCA